MRSGKKLVKQQVIWAVVAIVLLAAVMSAMSRSRAKTAKMGLNTQASLATAAPVARTPAAAPQVERHPEREAYFGETHVHTSWSFDAYIFGNTKAGPEDAYKYALGETINHPAVTNQDHAAARFHGSD